MLRASFSLFLLAGLLLGGLRAQASGLHPDGPKDTIVVRLPNQATLTLLVRDAAQLRQLKNYHLDSLTARLAGYIKQAETAAESATSNQVTMEFYPDKDRPGQNLPEQIRITTNKQSPNGNRVDVALNKAFGVSVTRDKDGDKEYSISTDKAPKKPLSPADSVRHLYGRDQHVVKFRFDLGVNTFVNNQANAGGVPALKHFFANESGFYNVGLSYVQPISYQKRSRLAVTFGPEFSFNYFRLTGSNVWAEDGGRTVVVRAPDAMQIDQARLLVSTLNLPVMVEFKLLDRRGHRTLTVGAGGFGGYRLYSSAKAEYKLAGSDYTHEDVVSGPFHLNDWQYGLQGEIGFGFLRFIGKYQLNELFQANKGPQTHVLSVGLKFLGF